MRKPFFFKFLLLIAASVAAMSGVNALRSSGGLVSAQSGVTQGALQVVDPNGKPRAMCPLKHTDVKVVSHWTTWPRPGRVSSRR